MANRSNSNRIDPQSEEGKRRGPPEDLVGRGSFVSMALTQLVNRRGLPFAVTGRTQATVASEYGLAPSKASSRRGHAEGDALARRTGELREITGPARSCPMKLLATPRFSKSIPADRRDEVFAAMRAARCHYGQPHLHAGLGLRRIQPFMECRCGLDLRLVFQREGKRSSFTSAGRMMSRILSEEPT